MISSQFRVILLILSFGGAAAFQAPSHHGMHQSHHQFCNHDITICTRRNMNLQATTDGRTSTDNTPTGPGGSDDNKAMAFLRKVGRVGGAANMDFATAMGLDESPSGGSKSSYHEGGFKNVRKSKAAYIPCTTSGIIDDMSDPFPFTSSGSQWQGITDRVMGGLSNGSLSRETIGGKLANVLRGNVSLANNGGFIQMATDLSLEPSVNLFVDASAFDGVELEVYCEGSENVEKFNVHVRTTEFILPMHIYNTIWSMDSGAIAMGEFEDMDLVPTPSVCSNAASAGSSVDW